jgi:recombinational DNA repair ATPase RecF
MKLTQIEITNFRCFESLTVPLQPDVNVFVGVNASGKTAAILILNFRRSRVAGLQQWMLRYPTFPHRKRRRVYDERVGF